MPILMRSVLPALLLLSVSACDRGSADAEQDLAAADLQDGETFETADGLVGKLDISRRGADMLSNQFQDPDGETVSLPNFKGKPLLVNIWATWCAPCVVEMPMLDKLAVREKDRLQVLTVSQDIEGAAKVLPFFEKRKFTELEPYLDTENGLSFGYGTGLMPTTVLYDANGKEVWRVIGAMDWDGAKAASLLSDTLTK